MRAGPRRPHTQTTAARPSGTLGCPALTAAPPRQRAAGVAKYRGIPFLSPPDVIAGFIQNLVGECDEEEVIRGAKPSLPDGFKSGFKENASKRISTKTKARPSESAEEGAPAAREEAAS